MWWLVGLQSFLWYCAKISINVSGAPVWTKPGSQVPSTTFTTQLLMDQWWQGAFSSTPEGCQVVWYEWVFVCGVYMNERGHLSVHMCLWQSNCLQEVQSSQDNYQTYGAVNKLVCVYVKSFVFTKCVCMCPCIRMYGAVLLGRNAWGNHSLHHAWNATQVFLESTSHNCTWQSGAPATPTQSHRSGNSLNLHRELPELRC